MSTTSTLISSIAITTIHPSILLPTTLATFSTATMSAIPTSTSSNQINNGLSSAGAVESSSSLPTDPTSRLDREDVIIIIMIAVVVFLLFVFTVFYLFRRSRQSYQKRHMDVEEGKIEVAAARALWQVDDILKEGSYSHKSFQMMSPSMPQPPPPVAGSLTAHPLYHPGITRSRTLPTTRAAPIVPSRPVFSYPNIINGEKQSLEFSPSPISMASYTRSISNPMSALTTMQTRRPETPEPLEVIEPYRRAHPPEVFVGRSIRSFWSVESTSTAPSSPSVFSAPSIYSAPSPTINRSQNFLLPSPIPRDSPSVIYSPFRYPSPPVQYIPHESSWSTYPQLGLERDDSPTLHPSALSWSRVVGNRQSMLPSSPSSTFPPQSQRSTTPPISPKPQRAPIYPVSKREAPESPPEPSMELSQLPLEDHIKRWLEGSTRTISAFGSILDEDPSPSRQSSSPLAQTLENESSQDEEKEKKQRPAPSRRISPIRSMRSSASRNGSIGEAF